MSNATHKKAKIRLYCNREHGGKNYLLYKEGYGWICPRRGYEKKVNEWKNARI